MGYDQSILIAERVVTAIGTSKAGFSFLWQSGASGLNHFSTLPKMGGRVLRRDGGMEISILNRQRIGIEPSTFIPFPDLFPIYGVEFSAFVSLIPSFGFGDPTLFDVMIWLVKAMQYCLDQPDPLNRLEFDGFFSKLAYKRGELDAIDWEEIRKRYER